MKWTITGLFASLGLIVGSVGITQFNVEPDVQVEPRSVDISLGTVATKSCTDFDFEIINRGDNPLKIRGKSNACNLQGCVLTVEIPGIVARHQSARIRMQYKSNQSGPFEQESTLFFEDINDQSERRTGYALPIKVRGISVADEMIDGHPSSFPL